MNAHPDPDGLMQALAALPDPEPSAPLFERIMDSRQRRRRQRRWAAAGALSVMLAALWPAWGLLQTGTLPADDLAASGEPAVLPTPVPASLRVIDRRLQVAYDRGADDAELAALWAARARVLATEGANPVQVQEETHDARILSL